MSDVVTRARALVGTRFRPQGRGEAGLDCVGLVAAALGREAPGDYALRHGAVERVAAGLVAAGLHEAADRRPGDVILCRAGPGQLHLGIWTGDGLVHADAALRRVVERPGEPLWPILSIWRL